MFPHLCCHIITQNWNYLKNKNIENYFTNGLSEIDTIKQKILQLETQKVYEIMITRMNGFFNSCRNRKILYLQNALNENLQISFSNAIILISLEKVVL